MAYSDAPHYPIVYVRGFAMTRGEIDDTAADPFCGFNLGSTVYRASADRTQPARKYVFESPVVRLASDFGYRDVFEDGVDLVDSGSSAPIPAKAIVIYRYYDEASTLVGSGKTPSIESFASGLGRLILKVRDLVSANPANGMRPEDFRCYLVAHSMGGLVCRAFLQNPACGTEEARRAVDKFFTYATPHNGIELAGVNVPRWLTAMDIDTFNRDRMAVYLGLGPIYRKTGRVDWLVEDQFPIERVFCLVGTNRGDYDAGRGLSRTFAGEGSDGLVRIGNASAWGISRDATIKRPCATAYAFRSHSGPFGIVNSEEAYQNLIRFLFGDVRVDVWVDVRSVSLPAELEGKKVDALYEFEVEASPRGKPWYLTRRAAEEDSVACRRQAELTGPPGQDSRSVYLSTVFLANRARVNPDRKSLAYTLSLGVRVPDYEIERRMWLDGHFEGRYLFRDTVTVEMEPPSAPREQWKVGYAWGSKSLASALEDLDAARIRKGTVEIKVPFDSGTVPGIAGQLRFVVAAWNA